MVNKKVCSSIPREEFTRFVYLFSGTHHNFKKCEKIKCHVLLVITLNSNCEAQ
jgi:hypothetical protein